jgi:hypothetical protein
MMTKTIKYSAYLALAILTATFQGCRPDDAISGISDIKLTLSPDVFNYYYELTILDENGNPMPYAECSIARSDRDLVFSQLGERTLSVDDAGKTIVVLHPYKEPTLNDPVQFTLLVSAPGYDTYVKVVDVEEGMFNLEEQILMQPENGVTDYGEFETVELTLVNGELDNTSIYNKSGSNTVHIASKTANNDSLVYQGSANSAVVLAKGTKFFYMERQFFEGQLVTEPVYSEPVVEFVRDSVFEDGAWVIKTYKKEVPARLLRMDTIIFEEPGYELVRKEYTGKVKVKIFKTVRVPSSPLTASLLSQFNNNNYIINGLLGNIELRKRYFVSEGIYEDFGFKIYGAVNNEPVLLTAEIDSGQAVVVSAKIDPNAINSLTNAPFQEGDSLEMGGWYYHKPSGQLKTPRYAIKKTRNGELRVERISIMIGGRILRGVNQISSFGFNKEYEYLYNASYSLSFNTDGIPDPENYGFSSTIYEATPTRDIPLFQGPYLNYPTIDLVIKSDVPIDFTNFILKGRESYWGESNEIRITGVGMNYSGGVIQPDDALFKDNTTYDLTLLCPSGNSIKPTYKGVVYANGRFGEVHIDQGQWATKGFSIGDQVRLSIRGVSFDTTITVAPNNTLTRELRNQGGQDICDGI